MAFCPKDRIILPHMLWSKREVTKINQKDHRDLPLGPPAFPTSVYETKNKVKTEGKTKGTHELLDIFKFTLKG